MQYKSTHNQPTLLAFDGFNSVSADDTVPDTIEHRTDPIHVLHKTFSIYVPSYNLGVPRERIDELIRARIDEWRNTPQGEFLYDHVAEPIECSTEVRYDSGNRYNDEIVTTRLTFRIAERHYLEYILTFK